jgi:chromate transporter
MERIGGSRLLLYFACCTHHGSHRLVIPALWTITAGLAVGQFTPGPVFSSVTFIGWQMNGAQVAILATIAVFLPSFFFVALLNPLVPRMRKSRLFSAFLDGVNIASVAIILAVCISFGRETISDWRTILTALLSLVVTFGFRKVNTVFLVIGSATLGYVLQLF